MVLVYAAFRGYNRLARLLASRYGDSVLWPLVCCNTT